MNQSMEQENEDQNMHVIESEPQGIADQVRKKEDQNVHVIQPDPQGLADEGERIPGIVEAVLNCLLIYCVNKNNYNINYL